MWDSSRLRRFLREPWRARILINNMNINHTITKMLLYWSGQIIHCSRISFSWFWIPGGGRFRKVLSSTWREWHVTCWTIIVVLLFFCILEFHFIFNQFCPKHILILFCCFHFFVHLLFLLSLLHLFDFFLLLLIPPPRSFQILNLLN